jgi:hypothetical protein
VKEEAANALAEWERIGREAQARANRLSFDDARVVAAAQGLALEEAVADLARHTPEVDLAALREQLHTEASHLCATTGHTYQSALWLLVERQAGGVELIERLGRDLRDTVQPLFDAIRGTAPQPRREPRPAPRVVGWQIGGIRTARRNRLRRR